MRVSWKKFRLSWVKVSIPRSTCYMSFIIKKNVLITSQRRKKANPRSHKIEKLEEEIKVSTCLTDSSCNNLKITMLPLQDRKKELHENINYIYVYRYPHIARGNMHGSSYAIRGGHRYFDGLYKWHTGSQAYTYI